MDRDRSLSAADLMVHARALWATDPDEAATDLFDTLDKMAHASDWQGISLVCDAVTSAEPIELAVVVLAVTHACADRLAAQERATARDVLFWATWERIAADGGEERADRVLGNLGKPKRVRFTTDELRELAAEGREVAAEFGRLTDGMTRMPGRIR